MTIHYHGTPLTPRDQLWLMAGKNFCVSYANPGDADVCLRIGQSVMWDNGAFSLFTKGKAVLASGAVGAVADSAAFLWLAFGSLEFMGGQLVGKLWMTLAVAAVLWVLHRRKEVTA